MICGTGRQYRTNVSKSGECCVQRSAQHSESGRPEMHRDGADIDMEHGAAPAVLDRADFAAGQGFGITSFSLHGSLLKFWNARAFMCKSGRKCRSLSQWPPLWPKLIVSRTFAGDHARPFPPKPSPSLGTRGSNGFRGLPGPALNWANRSWVAVGQPARFDGRDIHADRTAGISPVSWFWIGDRDRQNRSHKGSLFQ